MLFAAVPAQSGILGKPATVIGDLTWTKVLQWAEVPARIIFLILLGVLGRWLLFRAIDRLTVRISSPPTRLFGSKRAAEVARNGFGTNARQEQRAKALGSLFKSVVTGVIGVIVVATALGQLGFNLAPFLASAGVAGVALGFGAQSLIKDVFSGVFMLLEDQFGVGDVIDMNTTVGTVEAVGLRITRIRDADGVLWHMRNGEVLSVGNKSMGWSALSLTIDVAYDEDIERVQEIINEVGRELTEAKSWQDRIIAAPQAVGIQGVTSAAVSIQIFGQCSPSERTAVERELRRRLKTAFDQADVRLPTA